MNELQEIGSKDLRARSPIQFTQANKSIGWSSLANATASALGAAAAALNFIGQAAYAQFLGHWGFDEGLMPLDTTNRLHYGYMAVLEGIKSLLNEPVGLVIVAAIFVMMGIQFWVRSNFKERSFLNSKAGRWLRHQVGRLPGPLKNLLGSFGISGVIVILLYYVVLAAFVALAMAPIIGEHAATKWSQVKEKQIQKGCKPDAKRNVCTELVRDGKVVGTGFIIASSTTRIAYFDIGANHPRLIKFENGELTGWKP